MVQITTCPMKEGHDNYQSAKLIVVRLVPIRNISKLIRCLLHCKNIRHNLFMDVTKQFAKTKQMKAISKGITKDYWIY